MPTKSGKSSCFRLTPHHPECKNLQSRSGEVVPIRWNEAPLHLTLCVRTGGQYPLLPLRHTYLNPRTSSLT
jgi:hypothetical protein